MKKLFVIAPLLFLLSGCGAQWFPENNTFTNNSTATRPTVTSVLTDPTGTVKASGLTVGSVGTTADTATVQLTATVADAGAPGFSTITVVAIDKNGAQVPNTQFPFPQMTFNQGNGETQSVTSPFTIPQTSAALIDAGGAWEFSQVTYTPL